MSRHTPFQLDTLAFVERTRDGVAGRAQQHGGQVVLLPSEATALLDRFGLRVIEHDLRRTLGRAVEDGDIALVDVIDLVSRHQQRKIRDVERLRERVEAAASGFDEIDGMDAKRPA